ncbi:MAG: hypothetical protein HOV81_39550 [Kofleriaceae bacterium]|nr:hypothetical protein [Kofleriaceae bacterium]
MLVDRLDLALLASCVTGIVWMATPSPASPPDPPIVLAVDARVMCSLDGGMPELMQGPYAFLGDALGGELDVKTMVGVAPFDQLTVVRTGGTPDLTNHNRLVLAIRVDGGWYTRELADGLGPFCGGMGSPIWVDAEAGAPRIIDGAVSVRVHETYRQGDSERSSDSLVECRLEP